MQEEEEEEQRDHRAFQKLACKNHKAIDDGSISGDARQQSVPGRRRRRQVRRRLRRRPASRPGQGREGWRRSEEDMVRHWVGSERKRINIWRTEGGHGQQAGEGEEEERRRERGGGKVQGRETLTRLGAPHAAQIST
jgi:hypothetical protein